VKRTRRSATICPALGAELARSGEHLCPERITDVVPRGCPSCFDHVGTFLRRHLVHLGGSDDSADPGHAPKPTLEIATERVDASMRNDLERPCPLRWVKLDDAAVEPGQLVVQVSDEEWRFFTDGRGNRVRGTRPRRRAGRLSVAPRCRRGTRCTRGASPRR
jgi:hypothetical protein